MTEQQDQSAQQRFEDRYVTSQEICKRLHITRATVVHARRRGLLPDAIAVPGVQLIIWERAAIERYVAAWELMLRARRNPRASLTTLKAEARA